MRYMQEILVTISLCALGGTAMAAQTAEAPARSGAAQSRQQGQPSRQGQAPRQGQRGQGQQAAADGSRPAAQRQPASPPYISGDASLLYTVMAPAPKGGDARDEADRRIFRETRVHYGTPRWQMAADDAQLGNAKMLEHFACSLDIELTPEEAPKMVAFAQKVTREAAASMSKAKDFYKRQRPFKGDVGPTCVEASSIGESYDYPSGHTTAGWAWGLVLSQVDPSRAGPLLARGRAIGDSRVVCGMHNASAVENARMLTGAAVSLASASPLYQADLAYARAELATLRAGEYKKPDPARCAAEAELVKPYW
ncbi:MAG TPA: phosphatase PAP2 family protein [Steroidobacteraceae bacterium]|nr:phosphatase PAP2 family protein [Steroidobacteraceae bacterium]